MATLTLPTVSTLTAPANPATTCPSAGSLPPSFALPLRSDHACQRVAWRRSMWHYRAAAAESPTFATSLRPLASHNPILPQSLVTTSPPSTLLWRHKSLAGHDISTYATITSGASLWTALPVLSTSLVLSLLPTSSPSPSQPPSSSPMLAACSSFLVTSCPKPPIAPMLTLPE